MLEFWNSLNMASDVLALSVHVLFASVAVVICLINCARKVRSRGLVLKFFGHECSWLLTILTVAILILKVLEGILSDVRSSTLNPVAHSSNAMAILAAILVLVLYNVAEILHSPAYLLVIFSYWFLSAVAKVVELKALTSDETTHLHVNGSAKLFLICLIMALYLLLVVLNIIILVKQGIRRPVPHVDLSSGTNVVENDNLATLKYVHSYVCLLSKILLHWFNKVLITGYRKCLTLNDLGQIPLTDSSHLNYRKLQDLFDQEKSRSFMLNKSPSLIRCFWKMTKPMMSLAGLFKITSDLLIYVPTICLNFIVNFLMAYDQGRVAFLASDQMNGSLPSNHSSVSDPLPLLSVYDFFANAYVVAVLCFFVLLIQMTLFQHHLFIAVREGIRCKCAVQAMVFNKTMRLLTSSVNEGKLTNYMTVDPLHVVMIFMFIHSIWTMPIQIAVGLIMLYIQLGTSALISGLLLLFMVGVQYLVGQRLGRTQEKIMEQSDERLKQSNEMLQSIKLLKLYAWEKIFFQSVIVTRTKELRLMLTASFLRVLSITVTDGVPYFACLLTFILYHYLESEPLHPGKVFSGLALFAIFGGQLFVITLMINVTSQAKTSISRLRDFFLLPEIQSQQTSSNTKVVDSVLPDDEKPLQNGLGEEMIPMVTTTSEVADLPKSSDEDLSKYAIAIYDGNFGLAEKQILFDINVKIPTGKLTMVVGPVGSGKSSLLWAMLCEMSKFSGLVFRRSDSIAYVPQKSWILNSTIQENITFGQPFDPVRYQKVLEVSHLEPDIAMFVAGDQTEIGEKGANLSGGQRQRVSIARALYYNADVYLMDDPLSALDAVVGSKIFEDAVMNSLIQNGKTVVLLTHHVHLLPYADQLIVMRDGRVFYSGSAEDLISQPNLISIASGQPQIGRHLKVNLDVPDSEPHLHLLPSMTMAAGIKAALSFSTLSMMSEDLDFDEPHVKTDTRAVDSVPAEAEIGRLIEEEEISTGAISYRYFLGYFRSATWLMTCLAISFYSIRLALRMFGDFWLTKLIDVSVLTKSGEPNLENITAFDNATDVNADQQLEYGMEYYIGIYVCLTAIAILMVPFGTLFLELMALTASRTLHQKMLQQIVLAPLRFFDTNPIGRIVNRLSADMNVIDEKLTVIFDAFLFCALSVIGGVIINCVFVPYFIVPVLPIVILFIFVQRFCISSCRELQRLDCKTKSPILAHFSQMIAGLTTIRAYRCEERFRLQNFEKINTNNVAFLFFHTCHLWLGLRLDYLGSLLVLTASLSSITTCVMGAIDPSTVGLVISYAIMICSLMNWTMRNLSEMEVYFGSVERVFQYTTIEPEPYERIRGPMPSVEWPSSGEIMFEAVTLQYSADLDPVINDFSLHITSGMKVGICGRTGSGKSSLTLSLFRMVNISKGRILLDGLDICDVPLELLRSKLSIIPQEPVLFSGTVRFNLDPLQRQTDEEIWNVLDIAQLKDLVSGLPQGLDTMVMEGGDNFSIGQRQLFCLARALLRNAKVLVMDEATASIDTETDLQIQEIVKRAFAHCTVITIAHRLSTIRNCDLVVVLRDGQKIEEGNPEELVALGGAFASMLAENQL